MNFLVVSSKSDNVIQSYVENQTTSAKRIKWINRQSNECSESKKL